MKRIMNLYDNCKLPIRIAFFGFILIAFGYLIQNENVNIFYTFKNNFLLLFAEGCLSLGRTIVTNLPLIFMLNLVCKKANSGTPLLLALVGYFAYLIALSLFSNQTLSSYAYTNSSTINSIVQITNSGRYPLETGMIGSFLVGYITRYSYIKSRHRTSHSILGFLEKDSAAIIYNIVFCTLAGIAMALVFPYLYTYLATLVTYISRDLADPIRIGIYGILDRGLSILGLGNFIRYPFWYTALGGSYQTLSGQAIVGDVNIWDYVKDFVSTYSGSGRFITPYYVINLFMIPAIYLGILTSMSDKQERNRYLLLFIMGILLSIAAGNPLPIELLLLFTCPIILVAYLALVAVVFGYLSYAGIYLGASISSAYSTLTAMPGSFPDLIINIRSVIYYDSFIQIILVGLVAALIMFVLCFVYFRFLAYDLINTTKDEAVINRIVYAIGGYDNIIDCGSGFFKVNFTLEDNEKISVEKLSESGNNRITETKNGISIECGSSSYIFAKKVKKYLKELGH